PGLVEDGLLQHLAVPVDRLSDGLRHLHRPQGNADGAVAADHDADLDGHSDPRVCVDGHPQQQRPAQCVPDVAGPRPKNWRAKHERLPILEPDVGTGPGFHLRAHGHPGDLLVQRLQAGDGLGWLVGEVVRRLARQHPTHGLRGALAGNRLLHLGRGGCPRH
nr:hypothetical protein [Tanacetum cinerariifolium]